MVKKNQLKQFKADNRKEILLLLYREGMSSRTAIAQKLCFTKAAISNLVSELIDEGVIVETGDFAKKSGKNGPKERLLALNEAYGTVIGLDIDREYVTVGLLSLNRTVIGDTYKRREALPEDAEGLLEGIYALIRSLLGQYEHPPLFGCGVTIVGTVDRYRGISVNSFGLLPPDTAIGPWLQERLHVPVRVENTIKACAMANHYEYTDSGKKNSIYLKHSKGIGGAIIIDNGTYQDSANVSGEVGHTVIPGNTRKCWCGRVGCLETLVGEQALFDNLPIEKSETLYELCHGDKHRLTMAQVTEAINRGEKQIAECFREPLSYMANMVVNLYIITKPEVIILQGIIFECPDILDIFCGQIKDIYEDDSILQVMTVRKTSNTKNYYGAADSIIRKFLSSGAPGLPGSTEKKAQTALIEE